MGLVLIGGLVGGALSIMMMMMMGMEMWTWTVKRLWRRRGLNR